MAKLPIDLVKKLYYEEKLSAREIGKKLNVTPWVIFKFMNKYGLERRNAHDTNLIKFQKKPLSFLAKDNLTQSEEKLRIAGLMLYWAEGSKTNNTVDLANSNPNIIKLFLRFLRTICGIDKKRLRVYLYCYKNQDVDAIKNYWSCLTKIPLEQFSKPYVRSDFKPEKSGKMKYGLAHVRYHDKKLLEQINQWIEEYLEYFNA
jgi:hypothetical protein